MVDHVIQFRDVIVGPYNVHAMVATGNEGSLYQAAMTCGPCLVLHPCMYTQCKLTIDSFRDTLFTLLAAKENKFFTDFYRKDATSSGFTLVSTSVSLKGLNAGRYIFS